MIDKPHRQQLVTPPNESIPRRLGWVGVVAVNRCAGVFEVFLFKAQFGFLLVSGVEVNCRVSCGYMFGIHITGPCYANVFVRCILRRASRCMPPGTQAAPTQVILCHAYAMHIPITHSIGHIEQRYRKK